MAAVIKTLMSDEPVPWLLYGIGALIAISMQMIGVPALAFALGMYIPLELNTPLLVGGFIAHLVAKSAGKDEKLASARNSRGILIASGFIAGGAVMGVVATVFKFLATDEKVASAIGTAIPSFLAWNFGFAEGMGPELLALGRVRPPRASTCTGTRAGRTGRPEPWTTSTATVATAVLGLDTLWGGDVMNPSGTGRFIADSWFSDEPLPAAYTAPEAAARCARRGRVDEARGARGPRRLPRRGRRRAARSRTCRDEAGRGGGAPRRATSRGSGSAST